MFAAHGLRLGWHLSKRIAGESVADAQLAAFKRNAADQGGVCDVGLWRCSRHRNYFFEWFIRRSST